MAVGVYTDNKTRSNIAMPCTLIARESSAPCVCTQCYHQAKNQTAFITCGMPGRRATATTQRCIVETAQSIARVPLSGLLFAHSHWGSKMMITIFGPLSVFIELEELYASRYGHVCVRDDLFACVRPGHDTRDDRFVRPWRAVWTCAPRRARARICAQLRRPAWGGYFHIFVISSVLAV